MTSRIFRYLATSPLPIIHPISRRVIQNTAARLKGERLPEGVIALINDV